MEYHQISWIAIVILLALSFVPLPKRWGLNLRIASFFISVCLLTFQEMMFSIPLTIRIDLIILIPMLALSFLTICLLVINRARGIESETPFVLLRQWRRTYDVLVVPVWLLSIGGMYLIGGNILGIELLGNFYWVVPLTMIGGVLSKQAGISFGRYLFLFAVPFELVHTSLVAMRVETINDWFVAIQSICALFYFLGLIVYSTDAPQIRKPMKRGEGKSTQ